MKRFFFTFFFTIFLTVIFFSGIRKGEQKAEETNLFEMLSQFEKDAPSHQQSSRSEKEDMWVYGIKTDFQIHQIIERDINKAAKKFAEQFNKEGLITDMRKGPNLCYVFGVSPDHKSGKGVTLIKDRNNNESIIVIPSSHAVQNEEISPPALPERIRRIFHDINIKKTIYSHSPQRTMLVFSFPLSYGAAVTRISQEVHELGYKQQDFKGTPRKNSTLMYFTKNERECFFEVTRINRSTVNIFTAEYPR